MLQYATIQYALFKPYATSKMELFVAEIKLWLETVVDVLFHRDLS